jgi:hypothetical protein
MSVQAPIRRLLFISPCILLLLLWTAFTPGAGLQAEVFVEDFSSLLHCDAAHTTAWWDTNSGTLRLPPYAMQIVGALPLGEDQNARDLVLAGDHAYVAVEDGGFYVADINDPSAPRWVASLSFPFGMGLDVDGDLACVAGLDRLVFIDITHPEAPWMRGALTGLREATAVALCGDVAYVASGNAGLLCVDFSDPDAPAIIGQVDTPGYASALALYGDWAYVADGFFGIAVIDVSDPASPVRVSEIPTSVEPNHVRIAGDLAFVADVSGELLVYALTDPAAPVLIGSCALPGQAQDVAVDGRHAYATVGDDTHRAIFRIDVSDPAAPVLEEGIPLPGFPVAVRLAGEHAFVAGLWDGLFALRIADSVAPAVVNLMPEVDSVHGFRVEGRLGYALCELGGQRVLCTLSLADPEQPAILGHCAFPGYPLDMAVSPPWAYVCTFDGLAVVDVGDPAQPQVIGTLALPGTSTCAEPFGEYLFMGYVDAGTGFRTIDVRDPEHPVLVSAVPLDRPVRSFCRSGDYLIFPNWEDGQLRNGDRQSDIAVYDISDPVHPVAAGAFTIENAYVDWLCADGNLLYASFWSFLNQFGNGVVIYDITDPAHPAFLGRYEGGEGMGQCVPAGNLVFLAGGSRIDMLDVSDPTAPRLLHSLATPYEILWLQRAGDHLFAMSAYQGLLSVRVLDRSADASQNLAQSLVLPAAEKTISHVRMEAEATPAAAWEFSADAGAHWQALPRPGDWLVLEHPGNEPLWRATLLYTEIGEPPVVDELRLEWISDATASLPAAPAAFALHAPAPNPFNPATTLRFDLPAACAVKLEIVDVSGRCMRVLVDELLPAGRHEAVWDGRDARGRALASGVYSCRLRAGAFEQARTLVLLK